MQPNPTNALIMPNHDRSHLPQPLATLLPWLVLAAGIAVAGWFVGHGFTEGRSGDRYVTVKGVAEREATADVALWPLRLSAADNDLAAAQARIARNTAAVYEFLQRQGLDTAQVDLQGVDVADAFANQFGGERPSAARFVVSQTVMVRSSNVERVRAASAKVGELVRSGVVVSQTGYGPSGPTFLFTRLNDLKPAMIAAATANARQAAVQFANDSRSRLGGIRRANQGVFVILPRDQVGGIPEETQPLKTVRVVTTVEYYLSD
jgi:hypothetical protein